MACPAGQGSAHNPQVCGSSPHPGIAESTRISPTKTGSDNQLRQALRGGSIPTQSDRFRPRPDAARYPWRYCACVVANPDLVAVVDARSRNRDAARINN